MHLYSGFDNNNGTAGGWIEAILLIVFPIIRFCPLFKTELISIEKHVLKLWDIFRRIDHCGDSVKECIIGKNEFQRVSFDNFISYRIWKSFQI